MELRTCLQFAAMIWLGGCMTLTGAEYPFYKNYTINDGLISNKVYHILEDRDGFIWICTNLGVSRYDGVQFVNFTSKNGLPSNEILRAFEDKAGRIWFMSFNNEPCYYYRGKIFNAGNDSLLMRIRKNKAEGMCLSAVVQYNSSMAFMIDNGKYGKIMVGKDIEDIPIQEPLSEIYRMRGHLYQNIMFRKGDDYYMIHTFDILHWKHGVDVHLIDFFPRTKFTYTIAPGDRVYGLMQKDGISLLVEFDVTGRKKKSIEVSAECREVYANGQWKVLAGDHRYTIYDSTFTRIIESTELPFTFEKLYVDRAGNKWFGTTDQGLYFIRKPAPSTIVLKDNMGMGITDIRVCDRKLFLSTEHHGVVSVDSDGNHKVIFKHQEMGRVRGFMPGRTRTILGADYGIYLLDKQFRLLKKIPVDATKDVERGFNQQVLVSTAGATYVIENDSLKEIRHGRGTSVAAMDERTVWIGTQKGIYISVRMNDSWHHYKPKLDPVLDRSSIADIQRDQYGNMWVATEQEGVFFCPVKGQVVRFCESPQSGRSILSNVCQQIVVAPDGSIWLATVNGISVIRYQDEKGLPVFILNNYSIAEGVPGKIVNTLAFYNGKIALATPEGLSVITGLKPASGITNETVITSVAVGSQYRYCEEITLPYDSNNLIISYASSFINTTMAYLFRYRVKELDQNWIETPALQVPLLGLEPGMYTFEIASVDAIGKAGKVAVVHITILTPWHRQWWFLCCVLLVVISAVLYYIKLERSKMSLGKHLALMRLRMLRAQMNPHFVFNALTNIQSLIQVKGSDVANDYIGILASILRKSIEYSDKEFVPLDKELEYTRSYLEIEKLRFGEKFDYKISFGEKAETLGSCFVPPLLLQPLVENAIKHGFAGISHKGEIYIHIEKQGQQAIKYNICDNGRGFDNKGISGKEYGLGITRERIELLYKNMHQKGYMSIQSGTRKGTCIIIELPILKA